MELDYDRAELKKSELIDAVARALAATSVNADEDRQTALEIISNYASISPPEKERMVMQLITMNHGGRGGAESTKAGNVQFNIGKLCIAASKGAFATVAVSNTPWLAVFAALILWDEFWACTKVSLSEDAASVLYAMWMHKDADRCIAANDVEAKVNMERAKRSQSSLTSAQVRSCFKTLEQLSCIKHPNDFPSKWWLCEWVRFPYR